MRRTARADRVDGLELADGESVTARYYSEASVEFQIDGKSHFELVLDGAQPTTVAALSDGRVLSAPALERNGERLVLSGAFGVVYDALKQSSSAEDLARYLILECSQRFGQANASLGMKSCIQCLEMMVSRGWVTASVIPGHLTLSVRIPDQGLITYNEA